MRDPLTWSKRRRLRRWVLKEFSREHAAVVRTAADPRQRTAFTRHAARAGALSRIFQVTGHARDEVAYLVLERTIEPATWDAAYQGMRDEVAAKLAALHLPVRRSPTAGPDRADADRAPGRARWA